jgi:serine/threonine-protein kinase ATR
MQQGSSTASVAFEHYEPYLVDTCRQLWQYFQRWTTSLDKRPLYDNTVAVYLQLLEVMALPVKSCRRSPSNSAKATRSLTAGITSLLDKCDLSPLNQLRLASLLVHLRSEVIDSSGTMVAARRRVGQPSSIVKELESNITQVCRKPEKFTAFQKDLQVCITNTYLPQS